jgi:hypothetical protein
MTDNNNANSINLSVTLPPGSVMIPSWLAVCFVVCFVLSTFTLVLVWNASSRLVGEIRVLQIYEEDVENVLIRSGIATRSDFIPRAALAIKPTTTSGEKK